MSRTIDRLQVHLEMEIFHYAQDSKKAAGRFLGTLVEIITYYKLCSWGFSKYILIEKAVPEFGRPDIRHNVEFSLHPVLSERSIEVPFIGKGISASVIGRIANFEPKLAAKLMSSDRLLRNSAVLGEADGIVRVANLQEVGHHHVDVTVAEVDIIPVAIFECKRVGVEAGMKKGPQSIEKAKQGAYVARSVSALQKVIDEDGNVFGFLPGKGIDPVIHDYDALLDGILSGRVAAPKSFVLTVGIVSDHGNWFTSDSMNKELKVLAAAYDWLLFLTDEGMMQFVEECILEPSSDTMAIRDAFHSSYNGEKRGNRFTKTQMSLDADQSLRNYFKLNGHKTDAWFNIITPKGGSLPMLSKQLIAILKRESDAL